MVVWERKDNRDRRVKEKKVSHQMKGSIYSKWVFSWGEENEG